MNILRSVLSNQHGPEGGGGSNVDTVEKLVERYETASLLEDKRDIVRALKSLSKKCRVEVGSRAMTVLLDVMHQYSSSPEILSYALDTLAIVICGDTDEESELTEEESNELGERFTEIFIKDKANVTLLLGLIEDYEFQVKWPVVKALTGLIRHQPKSLQDCILANPNSVPKIMDLLADSREIIRNDALLLLIELSRGNSNIQKIVAFENAFERLLDIIYDEGDSIVSEDCLYVILNLLKNNSSNQQLFRENSLIHRLRPLFKLGSRHDRGEHDSQGTSDDYDDPRSGGSRGVEIMWTAQKVSNVHLLLQVVRTLVSPTNSYNQIAACQKVIYQCGLLKEICDTLMSSGSPADVLTEVINTAGEVIRGNQINQDCFASIQCPSDPPRAILLVLMMSMVNDKQPFYLRAAVLYCIQCYLYKNNTGKHDILQTLLPTSVEANSVTPGHLLCTGLLSADPVVIWFASSALAHCVVESVAQKELLLKVQLATSLGNPPASLLQQLMNVLLVGSTKPQSKIGIMCLLCQWLAGCPVAVAHFLQHSDNIPYLISQASTSEGDEQEVILQGLCALLLGICLHYNDDSVDKFNREALRQIVDRRIGCELFVEKLSSISKAESYARAAQRPQLRVKSPQELVFDHEFTKLYKSLESDLIRDIRPEQLAVVNGMSGARPHTLEQHDNIVQRYKDLIKQQDSELTKLRAELKRLQGEVDHWQQQVHSLQSQIQDRPPQPHAPSAASQLFGGDNSEELSSLRKELETKCTLLSEKDTALAQQQQRIQQLESSSSGGESNKTQVEALSEQIGFMQQLVQQREQESLWYHQHAEQMRNWFTQNSNCDPSSALSGQISELESQLAAGWKEYERLAGEVGNLGEDRQRLQNQVEQLQTQHKKASEERDAAVELAVEREKELTALKQEHEDLLVLLADQDQKIMEYRNHLKRLGVQVDSDEEPVSEPT